MWWWIGDPGLINRRRMEIAATAFVVGSTDIVSVGAASLVYALSRSPLPPWSASAATVSLNANDVVYHRLQLNLADLVDVAEALPLLSGITHVSYAALFPWLARPTSTCSKTSSLQSSPMHSSKSASRQSSIISSTNPTPNGNLIRLFCDAPILQGSAAP